MEYRSTPPYEDDLDEVLTSGAQSQLVTTIMRLTTASKELFLVDKKIFMELRHLDLCGKVTYENAEAKCMGGFSESLQGPLPP